MTIWIDPPRWPAHGRLWSHLISDSSIEELHDFAARCGIPRRGFEGDHYDVPEERYAAVVAAGAVETTGGNLVRRLQQSGLRLRKRKGERGIARIAGVRFPDGSRADVDLVRSSLAPPDYAVFAATVYVQDALDRWLAVWSPRRQEWSAPGGWRESGETPRATAIRETLEETGIRLDGLVFERVGYERFYPMPDSPWPVPDGRFLVVFRVRLGVAGAPTDGPADEPSRWLTASEFLSAVADCWWQPMAQAAIHG